MRYSRPDYETIWESPNGKYVLFAIPLWPFLRATLMTHDNKGHWWAISRERAPLYVQSAISAQKQPAP